MESAGPEDFIKCTRCPIRQAQEAFPRALSLKFLKTCKDCTEKLALQRQKQRQNREDTPTSSRKGPKTRTLERRMELQWPEFISLVNEHKSTAFELDVELRLEQFSRRTESMDNRDTANAIADEIWKATGYRFIYKKCETSRTSDQVKMFVFYCAQIPGIHVSDAPESTDALEEDITDLGQRILDARKAGVGERVTHEGNRAGEEEESGSKNGSSPQPPENEVNKSDISNDESSEPRIYFSEARRQHLKRCFDDMLNASSSSGGLHPKMGAILENVFKQIEKVGGDIGKHKRRRKSPRTWQDSNKNTLFLD